MLQSDLCGYSDAYSVVKGIIMINCEVNLILTWSANCEITS